MKLLIALTACCVPLMVSCSTNGDAQPEGSTGKTRGQLVNECMTTGTPEECYRRYDKRGNGY